MPCRGIHCGGCRGSGDGGGVGVVLAVVVALIIIGAIAKPAESAARTAGHVLAVVLEVVLVSLAVVAAVAALVALGWASIRVRRWQSARHAQAVAFGRMSARLRAEVISPARPAIEPPKARFSGAGDLIPDHAESDAS
jgi:hypothetical protein